MHGDGDGSGLETARCLLIVVALNAGSAQDLTLDLTRFGQVPDGVTTRWSTATSGSGNRCTRRQGLRVSGKQLRVPFTQAEVQTMRMDGVAA
ncbi:hypothetical protein Q5530_33480 [Saccharothrix sp. BKS2]|uniref:hypothetical protein n=1 Tax=Saccharothrix sp. BKS2 TaxID=3064400 RepID=UPI0039EC82D0